MKKIPFGSTGLLVTKPAMGCLPLQRCTVDEAVKLLRAAYEGGINYYDTANAYTDSEKKIGLALSDVRENIVISTKSQARDREGVLAHIENSLRMLKTDYIDLFQFHQVPEVPDPEDPNGAYAGADLALAAKCKETGMGYIAMKGLAGGMLTNVRACHAFMKQYDNVVPIWGIQKLEELQQWLAVAEEDPDMDEELAAFIQRERQELSGSFCRSCGYCMPCPVGIEIRNCARMNMLLRRSPWQQYMTPEWQAKMNKIEDCLECRRCASRCPYQLDTPNLLKYMLKDYREFYETHKDLL